MPSAVLHAILHFVVALRLERLFDRRRYARRNLGVHVIATASKSRRASCLRPNSEPFLLVIHTSLRGYIPHPHAPGFPLPRRDPSGRALTQRFLRASFLFDDNGEQHQRSGGHQEE